jgi:NAD+ synthase (glutamine-hydrolysing)
MGHKPFGLSPYLEMDKFKEALKGLKKQDRHDLVFENVQARVRTHFLMNQGFVVGTGDLTEAALGWCTFNADHMSMYNPNCSVPKTLVKFLVKWAAENEFDGKTQKTLLDIVDTEISPELLPVDNEGKAQSTQDTLGAFELHDFFLFNIIRNGFSPDKVLFLAEYAFDGAYKKEVIHKTLKLFYEKFFRNQFKRNCVPDGVKVGSVSLSPRGDWRMSSDSDPTLWLKELQ